jgi:hypothetical protein
MPGSIASNRGHIPLAGLGPNLNRGTVVHERPDFFDLLIRTDLLVKSKVRFTMDR